MPESAALVVVFHTAGTLMWKHKRATGTAPWFSNQPIREKPQTSSPGTDDFLRFTSPQQTSSAPSQRDGLN